METHNPNTLAVKGSTGFLVAGHGGGSQRKPAFDGLGDRPAAASVPGCYLRHFRGSRNGAKVPGMAATKSKFRCMQCEMIEEKCDCEKYCCLCQAQVDIRLCHDGLYYCPPCREACDYKTSDEA